MLFFFSHYVCLFSLFFFFFFSLYPILSPFSYFLFLIILLLFAFFLNFRYHSLILIPNGLICSQFLLCCFFFLLDRFFPILSYLSRHKSLSFLFFSITIHKFISPFSCSNKLSYTSISCILSLFSSSSLSKRYPLYHFQ